MATQPADLFGLGNKSMNDFSLLGPPQQQTARDVQKSFDASYPAFARYNQRFNIPPSKALLGEFNIDRALGQAQASAGFMNQNQQLQHMIDESHHTPHGVAENIAQWAPLLAQLGLASNLAFGSGSVGKGVGTAYDWLKKQLGYGTAEPSLRTTSPYDYPPYSQNAPPTDFKDYGFDYGNAYYNNIDQYYGSQPYYDPAMDFNYLSYVPEL